MTVALIVAAVAGTIIIFLVQSLLPSAPAFRWANGSDTYLLNILIVLVTGLPIYMSEEWKGQLNSRMLVQQYRVLQLEQQQTLFELELLRAKINSHFLYNIHNTIAGLITEAPSKAESLVLLLSKFFRSTLTKDNVVFHAVHEELDILYTYLEMQQLRFGSRMTSNIHVAAITRFILMPSFILQPIVENAVKHGIEANAGDGFVHVDIQSDDTNLTFTVADSGPPFPDLPGGGVGLQLVMNKLKFLYDTNYQIVFSNTPEKHVRITIPRQPDNLACR
ncbi:histidine kinase [Chitinophaga pendula]|uniref:sensor histidine kinase n=1 Tax=Chitinophaga TaxID=79328 RepID=UPI0012FD6B76|nr:MULTISPECIES: histidine kinase [Chitinophaga]UCJ05105.1 histidine kinase [Chitinophaga pendula]